MRRMDWITIVVIVAVVAVLCLVQYKTNAGDSANKGMVGCMMPKSANEAKGARQKSERSLAEEAEKKD